MPKADQLTPSALRGLTSQEAAARLASEGPKRSPAPVTGGCHASSVTC